MLNLWGQDGRCAFVMYYEGHNAQVSRRDLLRQLWSKTMVDPEEFIDSLHNVYHAV